jgi:DNA-binding transcriptional ArsR family regulator
MGLSKTEEFTVRDNRLARYAKALGHPARVAILRVLAEKRACMCGDIVELLPIAQSTVSQHLKELKDAGLIQGDIDGPRVCYCINDKEWQRAKKTLNDFFVAVDACAAACCPTNGSSSTH